MGEIISMHGDTKIVHRIVIGKRQLYTFVWE